MTQPAQNPNLQNPTPPDDEGELALYSLHNLLHSVQFKLHPPTLNQRAEIAGALGYLDSQDPVRAALVRRCLRMAAVMAKEATELLTEGIDWATIERLFAPTEDEFQDSPQHWLAIARSPIRPLQAQAEPPVEVEQPAATKEATAQPSEPLPPKAILPPDTVAHPEDVFPDPMPPPRKASLQRHGRTLRDECNAERRVQRRAAALLCHRAFAWPADWRSRWGRHPRSALRTVSNPHRQPPRSDSAPVGTGRIRHRNPRPVLDAQARPSHAQSLTQRQSGCAASVSRVAPYPDPAQRTLDFDPIEATPEEKARLHREIAKWTREEAAEEFRPLPGESLSEFFAARERYLQSLDTFGPLFPRQPGAAWQIVQGRGRARPCRQPHQLTLPFDDPTQEAPSNGHAAALRP